MSSKGARRLITIAAAVAAGLTAGAASPGEGIDPPLGQVRMVPGPAARPSAQPHLRTSSRGVMLSWIERQGTVATLKFSEYARGQWSEARTVASGGDWFVNWADVPSVMRLNDGRLAAHWLQKSGASPYAYDVRLSHSDDGGRTWSPSFTPHHDGTQTEHGFASLFEVPGGLGIVWLDGRQMAGGAAHAGHGGAGGAMTIRYAAYDRDWSQVADRPIDERVCDCCPTAAAVTSEGPIVAFRNRTEDEVRDVFVSRLEAGRWSEPAAVHADGWKIAACPVNGPALAARGSRVVVAWFTAVGDVGHAYVAFSDDAGRTFGTPIRVDDAASQGRVDVELLPDGSAVASWIELQDRGAAFMMRRISPGAARSVTVKVAPLEGSRTSGYPRLALHGNELVFAWTDTAGGATMVRTAVAALRAPGSTR